MENTVQKPLIGAYLMLIVDNKVLLQRRKDGYYGGKYSLVAGHTEKGETVIEAIVREAKEESDIILEPESLEVKVIVHRPNASYKGGIVDIIDMFVFANTYQGNIKNNEPNKCSELEFYPIDNLPEDTIPFVRKALEAFQKGDLYIVC